MLSLHVGIYIQIKHIRVSIDIDKGYVGRIPTRSLTWDYKINVSETRAGSHRFLETRGHRAGSRAGRLLHRVVFYVTFYKR